MLNGLNLQQRSSDKSSTVIHFSESDLRFLDSSRANNSAAEKQNRKTGKAPTKNKKSSKWSQETALSSLV
jgi:hypothetical protein